LQFGRKIEQIRYALPKDCRAKVRFFPERAKVFAEKLVGCRIRATAGRSAGAHVGSISRKQLTEILAKKFELQRASASNIISRNMDDSFVEVTGMIKAANDDDDGSFDFN